MEVHDWCQFAFNDAYRTSFNDTCCLSMSHMLVVSPPLGGELLHAPKHGVLANTLLLVMNKVA